MDIEKTMKALKRNGFQVSYFETGAEAAAYLDKAIDGMTVGTGGSHTLLDIGVSKMLEKHNTVFDVMEENRPKELTFLDQCPNTFMTDVYLLSVNGMSETGELVNIDGTGNRVASSLFGHKKVYFVTGVNKIEPTLEAAIYRAKNVASPLNANELSCKTPCAAKADKCHDCKSPERICNAMVIYMGKMETMDMEVVIINENLGY